MERVQARTTDGWSLVSTLHRPDGAAIPVVLLHGLSQQRHYWMPVVRRMRSGPILAVDQRGHGDSDADETADFSLTACAGDVAVAMDQLDWTRAVIVGHSWGAAVALRFAAAFPDRTHACVLIDGGLWGPRDLGDPAQVRESLRPPALGLPEDELWRLVQGGDLGPYLNEEVRDALRPTFVANSQGLLATRIGMQRHMAVLDGLFEAEPQRDLALTADHGTPVWILAAESRPKGPSASAEISWGDARQLALQAAMSLPHVTTLRMTGAIHDVPLQWPDLVAGALDTVVATEGVR
jgi:pimeloyl-ACP methyl ester carboxylesterase